MSALLLPGHAEFAGHRGLRVMWRRVRNRAGAVSPRLPFGHDVGRSVAHCMMFGSLGWRNLLKQRGRCDKFAWSSLDSRGGPLATDNILNGNP